MSDEHRSAAAHELTIFISYRRSDTRADAGRLYDALRRRFGKDQLFMDVDSLQPGQDWVAAVEEAVTSSDVLLALIGDDWSTVTDASGRRRIEDDLDRVRLEIEAALKQDKPVIPVLFEDAHMPGPDELPDSLQSLRRRHAMRLSHDTFRYDLEPLIHSLRTIEAGKREKLGLPPRLTGERVTSAGATVAPTPAVETPPLPAQPVPPVAAASTSTPTMRPTVPPPAPSTPNQPAPSIASQPATSTYPTPVPPYQQPQQYQQPAQPYQSGAAPYGQQSQPYSQPWQYQQAAQPSYAPTPPYAQGPYGQPAYPGQWPAAQKTGAAANPLSIIAVILGIVALLFLPIIFGPLGIIVGAVGKSKKEPWATAAIIIAVAGMIIGFLFGAIVYFAS